MSRKGSDPDKLIWSGIRQEPRASAAEEHEFIIHSTSWCYERSGKILFTGVAYYDESSFEKGKVKSLTLKNLRILKNNSRKPLSQAELEKKVVSHALIGCN